MGSDQNKYDASYTQTYFYTCVYLLFYLYIRVHIVIVVIDMFLNRVSRKCALRSFIHPKMWRSSSLCILRQFTPKYISHNSMSFHVVDNMKIVFFEFFVTLNFYIKTYFTHEIFKFQDGRIDWILFWIIFRMIYYIRIFHYPVIKSIVTSTNITPALNLTFWFYLTLIDKK